jgi:hypothetical protein
MTRLVIQRVLICLAIGILIATGINESTFFFLRSESGRGPQRIELVIPAGTADRVAKGEANPALPANMVFVTGDTLIVKNEDVETHSLGPLLIPAGASASLNLDEANNYAYACSFQPGQYLGLDVREPVTGWTRIYGILFGGIPLGALMALYSLIALPIKKPASN